MAEDPGSVHLTRIAWYQVALLLLGTAGWCIRSLRASLAYALAGVASMLFWHLHRWIVGRMLTPSVRLRWAFGFLVLVKLALLALILRGIMDSFPMEVIPSVTGILLFSASILIEAVYLIFRPGVGENS
ncbi:MAG: hypothetical protein P4L36_12710 [Holophaga sp.]|nr:hypothetical protein [Holophaga sp.]